MYTRIHACTPTYIIGYRDILTFLHTCTCMNSYMKTTPHYPIDPRLWKNDIHSFWIFLWRLFKSTTTQRRSRPQQLTLCLSLHAEALQATVSEGLAQGSWR